MKKNKQSVSILIIISLGLFGCSTSDDKNVPAPSPMLPVIKQNFTVDESSSYTLRKSNLYVDRDLINPVPGFKNAGYADFNRDGFTDVIIAAGDGSSNRTPVYFLINDGTNLFFDSTQTILTGINPGSVHPRKVLIGDYNGDTWSDVLVIGHGWDQQPYPGECPLLFLSDANGHMAYSNSLESYIGFHHGGASADIDADGDVDILVLDNPFAMPFFLINDGHGNFTKNTRLLPGTLKEKQLYSCELNDIDKDGFVDIIAGGHENTVDMPTTIFWGNSMGNYSDSLKTVLPALPNWAVVLDYAAEDLTGDGLKEIIINRTNHYTGRYIQILKQISARHFVDESSTRITMDFSLQWFDYLRVQDIDGDGYLDIFLDDKRWNSSEKAWHNNGQGVFTPYWGEINPRY